MLRKPQQFSIQSTHFTDETHAFVAELSKHKKLSLKVAEWAEAEFKGENIRALNKVEYELDQIKRDLSELKKMFAYLISEGLVVPGIAQTVPGTEVELNKIVKVSSEDVYGQLEDDDKDYDY